MNLDFLVDLVPAKYRKLVYGTLGVISVVYGIWQATNGDWKQFAYGVAVAVVQAVATANTHVQASPSTDATDGTGTS